MFFLQRESETMQQLFYDCSYSIPFWKDFELYYLSLTQQQIHLNLKDILIGLLTPELPLSVTHRQNIFVGVQKE